MQLNKNKASFEWAASRAYNSFNNNDYASAMAWANAAGLIAYKCHPGFFTHLGLENMLNKIGKSAAFNKASNPTKSPSDLKKGKHWLHVLTTAAPVGGHTRLVERWINAHQTISNDSHSIFIVDQGSIPCPLWLVCAAEDTGGLCQILPDGTNLLERASILRNVAAESADVVVLHTHSNDPVASVAFANSEGPPVILLNHADHVFWYGSGVADLVADIRLVGQQHSIARRKIKQSELLPIPLTAKKNILPISEYKKKLGIPQDVTVVLSIGTSYKYKPYRSLNFAEAMVEMVKRNPDTLCIVIGPSPEEIEWKNAISRTNGSIKVMGVVQDIEAYYGAADIYVESFPVGSLTASLDAVLYEKPVIRSPLLLLPLLGIDKYLGMDDNAQDMDSYQNLLSHYIYDLKSRLNKGKVQKNAVENMHVGEGWNSYLKCLLNHIPITHTASTIDSIDDEVDNYQQSDIIWADILVDQSNAEETNFNACCNALRANIMYLSKWQFISGLMAAVTVNKVKLSKCNMIKLFEMITVTLSPKFIYHYLYKRYVINKWSMALRSTKDAL